MNAQKPKRLSVGGNVARDQEQVAVRYVVRKLSVEITDAAHAHDARDRSVTHRTAASWLRATRRIFTQVAKPWLPGSSGTSKARRPCMAVAPLIG
jgi:hypothetical protein